MSQSKAKEGYKYYWDQIIQGTKNPDAKELDLPKPMMRESYYANAESDKYPLISHQLKPVAPPTTGYTDKHIQDWIMDTKLSLKLGRIAWKTNGTFSLVEYDTDTKRVKDFSHWLDSLDDYYKEVAASTKKRAAPVAPGTAPATTSSTTSGGAVTPSATTTTNKK